VRGLYLETGLQSLAGPQAASAKLQAASDKPQAVDNKE